MKRSRNQIDKYPNIDRTLLQTTPTNSKSRMVNIWTSGKIVRWLFRVSNWNLGHHNIRNHDTFQHHLDHKEKTYILLAALGFYVSLISISSELVPPLFSFLGDGHAKLASPIWKTWKALEHKRTLVVHFASVERLDEFNLYWRSHEIHLFGKLDNSSLLLACPSLDIPEVMEQIIRHNNWTLVGAYAHQHPLAYGDMLRYQTLNNVDVSSSPL